VYDEHMATAAITGRCKTNVTNHRNQQILSVDRGAAARYGLDNFTHFIEYNCLRPWRGARRRGFPPVLPVVSVGHHVPDLDAAELGALLGELHGRLQELRRAAAARVRALSPSPTRKGQDRDKYPARADLASASAAAAAVGGAPTADDAAPPLFVWSNLASAVSLFDPRFPRVLQYRSNAYREALQNAVIKAALAGHRDRAADEEGHEGDEGGGLPRAGRKASAASPSSLSSSLLPVAYLDLYHPSLALGEVAHAQGDPVHMSADCRWFHRFVYVPAPAPASMHLPLLPCPRPSAPLVPCPSSSASRSHPDSPHTRTSLHLSCRYSVFAVAEDCRHRGDCHDPSAVYPPPLPPPPPPQPPRGVGASGGNATSSPVSAATATTRLRAKIRARLEREGLPTDGWAGGGAAGRATARLSDAPDGDPSSTNRGSSSGGSYEGDVEAPKSYSPRRDPMRWYGAPHGPNLHAWQVHTVPSTSPSAPLQRPLCVRHLTVPACCVGHVHVHVL
jgi:hypothetical protein